MTNDNEQLVIDRNFMKFFDRCHFDHPTTERRLIETHISYVLLTGKYAYKIKKPIDLGFVDYTTLAKRERYCQLELKLNRRFATNLYLGVVPLFEYNNWIFVGEDHDCQPVINGKIIDYAVKMRQFPQESIAASCLENDRISPTHVENFGRDLAILHLGIESVIPTIDCAQPIKVIDAAIENFSVLLQSFQDDERADDLKRLQDWTRSECERYANDFRDRLDAGRVKRCHGDLHLKNIILLDRRLIAFDGVEFNEQFQFIDVLSEIAFPVMDMFARGHHDLGWRLLNAYLEESGDYADLGLLRFYLVYRAMVRAKVAWMNQDNHTEKRRAQYASQDKPDDAYAGPWDKYIRTACFFAFEMQPKLTITHGFSGSGKSTAALKLIDESGGIRIRSDVLRLRLAKKFNVQQKYSSAMNDWVYAYLAELCRAGLKNGFPLVADATFLNDTRRKAFYDLAESSHVRFEIMDCRVSIIEMIERLKKRRGDASEANVKVLRAQMANHTPLTDLELKHVRELESGKKETQNVL